MALRKLLLIVGIAIGTLAPVAASAEANGLYWYDDDFKFSPNFLTQKTVEPRGELTFTIGELKIGPCEELVLEGEIYNTPSMGEGVIQEVFTEPSCPTNFANCTVLSSTAQNLPWEITLDTASNVKVTNVVFENHFSAGCQAHGIPSTLQISGNVTGAFVPYDKETEEIDKEERPATIEFDKSGDLSVGPLIAVTIDGELRFGTKVTAHTEP